MATVEVWYDQRPENDFGPGDPAIIVTTQDELTALIDRVSKKSATQPFPSLVEVSITEDPYGFPTVNADIGNERGYVRLRAVLAVYLEHGGLVPKEYADLHPPSMPTAADQGFEGQAQWRCGA